MYYVYKHTLPNGKVYIGMTGQPPKNRWRKGTAYIHNQAFYDAIQEYGWDAIKHEIVAEFEAKEEAEQMEIFLIKQFRSNDSRFGYNIENGGNCAGTHSDQTRIKISKSLTGKKFSEERKRNISNSKKGVLLSDETKKRMSEVRKGKKHKPLSEETKLKIASKHIGTTASQETKKKMSETRTGKSINSGRKVLCVETKITYNKIRDASAATGISADNISHCCRAAKNGKAEYMAGGFHWKYIE